MFDMYPKLFHFLRNSFAVSLAAAILTACLGQREVVDITPDVDWDIIATLGDSEQHVSWREDVQPVLEQRCIVCHGCYDAPCQLKLTSYDGLIRGANPVKVYNGSRFRAAEPTRLGIDANSVEEWQSKGFHSILGAAVDDPEAEPSDRLRDSVLYRMLRQKQLNPQPRTGLVPQSVTTTLDREQACAKQEDISTFERDNPLWGMPYGMPNLADEEYRTLVKWLATGAQAPSPATPSSKALPQIGRWETFLNGNSDKERLMSRYLYEHLFLGHMHFEGTPDREFYRLVRSHTPPGEPVQEVPTVRPFDDPGADPFWYRLRLFDRSIVAKSHSVYPLSDQRMARYKTLFLEPDYEVGELPDYVMPDSANPFKTYAVIPPMSRYEFLLDDARYFIMGFIKGPVCRGQVALNVIEDQFWVVFSDPKSLENRDQAAEALEAVADYLQMPTSTQTFNLLAAYRGFWEGQKAYLAARETYFEKLYKKKGTDAFSGIWDGGGSNPNAALTIFRNFDSAAVEYGLIGDYPETAWVIDYPLFERIHYLLVAGFDVYGNVGHQLNSRLFMDFLRMEGEDTFLTYLPTADRKRIRDQWYRGIREKREKYFAEPMAWSQIESPIDFKTDDPQRELYQLIEQHLGPVAGPVDFLNRCDETQCVSDGKTEKVRQADAITKLIHNIDRAVLKEDIEYIGIAPDNIFLRVRIDDEPDIHYTILRNKSYQNLSSLLDDGDSQLRDPVNDTYTIIRGFSGSYPNFFLSVPFNGLEQHIDEFVSINSLQNYQKFIARYGVRRTNPDFWEQSDWFHDQYRAQKPLEYGTFDLNRYGNY